jgi:hypothetical protein
LDYYFQLELVAEDFELEDLIALEGPVSACPRLELAED